MPHRLRNPKARLSILAIAMFAIGFLTVLPSTGWAACTEFQCGVMCATTCSENNCGSCVGGGETGGTCWYQCESCGGYGGCVEV